MDRTNAELNVELTAKHEDEQTDRVPLFRPLEAYEYAGRRIGRDAFYGKLHTGEIPSIKVGRRFLIPKAALDRYLEGQR